MDLYTAKKCEQCGGVTAPDDPNCPYCGAPLREFFKYPELVEECRNSMLDMETVIQTLPPGPGWGILLIWFGMPLLALAVGGFLLRGTAGWLAGAAGAVMVFFALTPLAANMREKLRFTQYERLVRPSLEKILENDLIQTEDLILLAHRDERLKKSALLGFLKAEASTLGYKTIPAF